MKLFILFQNSVAVKLKKFNPANVLKKKMKNKKKFKCPTIAVSKIILNT